MEVEAHCPYCGELVGLVIDEGGGRRQQYVEDCWVCCRPMAVRVLLDAGAARVDLGRADD
jgi:hypothetical protein